MATSPTRAGKRAAIVLIVLLAVAGAGIAYAYWSSSGTGAGTATTGESTAFTITSDDPPAGTIAPGSAGQTVGFTVTNPGKGTQYLTAVTVALATADGAPWEPTGGCLIEDYTATISTAPPAGDILAGGSVDGVATVTLANTASNQDACQGQDVPLYFTAS